jgi:hypothetical protein
MVLLTDVDNIENIFWISVLFSLLFYPLYLRKNLSFVNTGTNENIIDLQTLTSQIGYFFEIAFFAKSSNSLEVIMQ